MSGGDAGASGESGGGVPGGVPGGPMLSSEAELVPLSKNDARFAGAAVSRFSRCAFSSASIISFFRRIFWAYASSVPSLGAASFFARIGFGCDGGRDGGRGGGGTAAEGSGSGGSDGAGPAASAAVLTAGGPSDGGAVPHMSHFTAPASFTNEHIGHSNDILSSSSVLRRADETLPDRKKERETRVKFWKKDATNP